MKTTLQLLPRLRVVLAFCFVFDLSVGSTGAPLPPDACTAGKGATPPVAALALTTLESPPRAAAVSKPSVVSRNSWGCPDGQNSPAWTPATTTVTHLMVHHSAGTNSSADWAGVVRQIWNDHKFGNGWGDIGYNYLVDPNGVIYEGRAGGDNVIGAHFSCMNNGTMGVCLMGNFTSTTPTAAALNSLKQILAWKADQRGLAPNGTAYHATSALTLPVISGHRHANDSTQKCSSTECPGTTLFNLLGSIRSDVVTLINGGTTTAQKATNPSHANSATGRPISGSTLTWINGGGAVSYNVFFGTNPSPGVGQAEGNRTNASFTPPTLNYSTTYYWRIDSVSSSGSVTTGDVWSFTTLAQTSTATRMIALSGNLSFGNVNSGTTAQKTLTLSNSGNSTLTVASVSYPTGFSGSWSGTIASGASRDVIIAFAPTASATYSGNVTVASDATSGTATHAISGTGVSGASGPILALDVTTMNLPATGGRASFRVKNIGSGTLSWTMTSSGAWLNDFRGSGSATNVQGGDAFLEFPYQENTSSSPRTGTITIVATGVTGSPQTLTLTQAGATTIVLMPSTNANISASGATNQSFGITAGGTWTAVSNAAWLNITGGATGSGNGTVTYNVAANPDAQPRTGTLTVGGQAHTVSQLAAAALVLSPTTNANLSAAGVTNQAIAVTAPTGLNWSATTGVIWVTITSGASGSGNGTVTYIVAANTSTQARSGTITVGNQTHAVSQLASTSQILFADDVEAGPNNWSTQGTWQITTNSYHSATRSWTDSPGGNYQNNQNVSLVRAVSLAGASQATLTFWHKYELGAGDSVAIFAQTADEKYVELRRFFGSNATWRQDYISLDAFVGTTINLFFQIVSDESGTADGWYLDDFRITPDAAPLPEIDVQGSGRSIASNNDAPSAADGRDFGSTAVNGSGVQRTFTILNTGLATLNLSDTGQRVNSSSSEFVVVTQPAVSAIPSGSQTTFDVRFIPAAAGLRTAALTIPSNDPDEVVYIVKLQGIGSTTAPTIERQPVGATIEPGRTATLSVSATGNGINYQWYEGSAGSTAFPVGANSNQFTTPPLSATKMYWVRVYNSGGVVDSTAVQVTVTTALRAPAITRQPVDVSTLAGTTTTFAVVAEGEGLRYQWFKAPEQPLAGATSTSLTLVNVQPLDAGIYTVIVSNSAGSVTSAAARLEVLANNPPRVANLSIRASAGSGQDTLIVGLSISSGNTTNKPVLIRAVGPSLTSFGVSDALADPRLTIFRGTTNVSDNDNWSNDAQTLAASAQVGAFPLTAASRDAGLYLPTLGTGSYTVHITGNGGSNGIVLAEIYDASSSATFSSSTPRLVNVSARTRVGSANDILIAGFVVAGNGTRTVLIRAIGPTLTGFGVGGVLADPQVTLFSGSAAISSNDNWGGGSALGSAFSQVGAFPLVATSRDSALLVTLSPGAYSVHVLGVNNSTGIALIEVYEMP